MATDEEGREFPDVPKITRPLDPESVEAAAAEGPKDFVIVLAYRSTDGDVEEEFGHFVEEIKLLHKFKQDVRTYALVEKAAAEVLAIIEKPKEASSG